MPARMDPLYNPHDVDLKPSRLPKKVQWAAVGLFIFMLVLSVFFIFLERWRRSIFSLASAMIWLGLVRACCDSRIVGIFSIRSRVFDTVFNIFTGLGLMFFALSVDSLGS